jgi:hypothetical protein
MVLAFIPLAGLIALYVYITGFVLDIKLIDILKKKSSP